MRARRARASRVGAAAGRWCAAVAGMRGIRILD
jgi:hypothetical protein